MKKPLNKIFNTDRNRIGTQRKTPQGFIVADVVLARTGILEYTGKQIGKADEPDKVFRVWRPEEELSNIETIDSFRLAPFTLQHPSGAEAPDGMLNPSNVKTFMDGTVTENVYYKDGTLNAKVLITTDKAHSALKRIKESSIGFYSNYKYETGITPDGDAYDAIQCDILGNHVALVESGRSGSECRVLDSNKPNNGGGEMPDVIIKVAGLDCTVEKNSATIIEKEITSLDQKLADKDSVIADKDTQLATSDAKLAAANKEIEELKKSSSEDVMLAAIDARLELVEKAKALHPEIDCKGKDTATVMKEAISFANKDSADLLNDKSDDYITAFFDIAVTTASKKSSLDGALGGVINNPDTKQKNSAEEARQKALAAQDDSFIGNTLGG